MIKYNSEQNKLNSFLWRTLDKFRGSLPIESALTLFCQLLFYKFLDDNSSSLFVAEGINSLNFPNQMRLSVMASKNDESKLPEVFGKAMVAIEEMNRSLLNGIFTQTHIQYFNRAYGSRSGIVISELIWGLNDINFKLDNLRQVGINLSIVFAYLWDKFAEAELKRNGFFLVPKSLRMLLANLTHVRAKPNETIFDPNCGVGTLMIDIVRYQNEEGESPLIAYGQERYIHFFSIAKMQWIINGQDPNNIGIGDSLKNPYLAGASQLKQFDKIISCPPFNATGWGDNWATNDKFRRFDWGLPPANKADYAHILHAIASLNPEGSAIIVSTAGVLFREGQEGKIRRKLVDENIISAIIWLPAGLFNFWNIPLCILCIDKSRTERNKGILMIDLEAYPDTMRDKIGLNEATIAAITNVFASYMKHETITTDGNLFYRIITPDEIAANEYNLNTPRYIIRKAIEPNIDTAILVTDIIKFEKKLSAIDEEINEIRRKLNISN